MIANVCSNVPDDDDGDDDDDDCHGRGGKKVKSSVSSQRARYSTPGPFRDCSVRVLKLECLTQAKSRRLAAPLSPCHNGV
ncbi:hypothetical protein PoB_003720600 [Plakobranchus ocellatus]|uniref:Uncharacterized protein n=1 Tax=Plakobranchus ocellatus TaxID=259542 RepID=A0AAV4ARB3_9GAST|nr:hypothetical protein PoB_003720600 [Plakobranchus ocellatus]